MKKRSARDHQLSVVMLYLKSFQLTKTVDTSWPRWLAYIDRFSIGKAVAVEAFVAERARATSLKSIKICHLLIKNC